MTHNPTATTKNFQAWGRANRVIPQTTTAVFELSHEALAEMKHVQRIAATVPQEPEAEDAPRFGM